jgi:CheY-like chemotaxis protein
MRDQAEEIEILLVDDDAEDVVLIKEAMAEVKMHNHLSVVGDGVEALRFLRKEGEYSSASRPDLIFLDLNMPKMSGREVLAELKKDDDLKSIPVCVLTSSAAEEDIIKAYHLHANCYLTKPVEFNQFVKMVNSIKDFWLTAVHFPPKAKK